MKFDREKNNIVVLFLSMVVLFVLTIPKVSAAFPSSTNYKIQEYSFGSGTASSSSTHYSLNGVAGEVEFGRPASTNFKLGSGLTYLMKSNVPGAPTFTNPSNNYDRLQFILNTSNNASDATFAIQVSTDSAFLTNTMYVQTDNTLGSTLTNNNFQTYTNWGGATGSYLTGLSPHTTYYMRVKARQASFTESEYGPSASAATTDPSMTFSVDSSTLTFSNLNASNSYTDSSKSTILTTSTNAYNGYVVNARETAPLTSGSFTIPDYSGTNASPTTWSGLGFGYTTSDNNLAGGTADRFTNGGPKYAAFTTSSPGDPVADHTGPVTTAITNEAFTIGYRVTVNNVQQAATYKNTIVYVVVPSY